MRRGGHQDAGSRKETSGSQGKRPVKSSKPKVGSSRSPEASAGSPRSSSHSLAGTGSAASQGSASNNPLQTNQEISPSTHKCDECNNEYKWKHDLVAHKKAKHEGRTYPCTHEDCEYVAGYRSNLNRHVRAKHDKEKAYQCDQCSLSFSQKEHLTRHKKAHDGQREFQCRFCTCGYTTAEQLNRHVQRVHPYKCISCNQRFISKGEQYLHKCVPGSNLLG